jgi:Tol biopolymer transport system component
VPSTGGVAALLVSHAATESRPMYSPDGKQLAFISTRTGNGDIYRADARHGDLKRITFDDSLDQLDGWSRDGAWLYFIRQSRHRQLERRVSRRTNGGTPLQVSADRYTNEFFSAPRRTEDDRV